MCVRGGIAVSRAPRSSAVMGDHHSADRVSIVRRSATDEICRPSTPYCTDAWHEARATRDVAVRQENSTMVVVCRFARIMRTSATVFAACTLTALAASRCTGAEADERSCRWKYPF